MAKNLGTSQKSGTATKKQKNNSGNPNQVTNTKVKSGDYFRRFFEFDGNKEVKSHKCKLCPPSVDPVAQDLFSGYQNIMTHLQKHHQTYAELYKQTEGAGLVQSNLWTYSRKVNDIYSWMDLIVSEGLPFNAVEKETFCKYVKMGKISHTTLEKYMHLVTMEVEKNIAKSLPEKFALVFDGWTLDGASTHFCAVFAVWQDNVVLLAFSPMEEENDLSAQQHLEFLEFHLSVYNKSLANVICFIGDNVSTNKALSKLAKKPLVGCAAHRLNLEVQNFLNDYDPTLKVVSDLMSKLKTLKNSALLRDHTTKRPKLRCTTRWTGAMDMVQRYFDLKPIIKKIMKDSADDLKTMMPTPSQEKTLTSLNEIMQKLKSVFLRLQDRECNLYEARILFDSLTEEFPSLKHYITNKAEIIQSPDFENGVVKIMKGEALSKKEAIECAMLKISNSGVIGDVEDEGEADSHGSNYALSILAANKKKLDSTLQKKDIWMTVDFIPPTSALVESFFSTSKHVFGARRVGTTPVRVEEQMFLKQNRSYWDMSTVGTLKSNRKKARELAKSSDTSHEIGTDDAPMVIDK